MKDFMTLLREAEVGVMSIWFLCTVCRKVRRGRTACGRARVRTQGAAQALREAHCPLTLLAGQGGEGVLLRGGCSSSSSSCCSSSSSLTACL